jgi:hypothetical protein
MLLRVQGLQHTQQYDNTDNTCLTPSITPKGSLAHTYKLAFTGYCEQVDEDTDLFLLNYLVQPGVASAI